ncbi:uroporphyrinogen-III C-methyltransferase [uncultured Aquimarina sp.]|uniref:uroporphyrinogen-III C-methyltransferase n=1 Tax=uncultured Aquimarina sp. TaxID=575652 RepID=UPI002634954A|nr:uroporphyrinogen-III C-methyltransferase [uncultured Aquimarina sp.]
MHSHIAILGLGWLGNALAKKMISKGFEIKGSTISTEKLEELSKQPFYVGKIKVESDCIQGDWETFIENISTLIINFPPKRIANIETIFPAQIQQIIARTPKTIKVIFISSTSVYGTSEVPFIETELTSPIKPSGVGVLKAEQLLRGYFGKRLTILRLAGLIGPDRHPGKFLAGKRILKNPLVPVNLIHREDCIGLIETIINKECFGEIINGCASDHPIRKIYYEKAARLLNLELPNFEAAEKTSALKIIDNSKSKRVLGYQYIYDNPEAIFTKNKTGELSIIGAGPGNEKLLTRLAFEKLQEAEVILHDNLVSDAILNSNTEAEKIYVGRKYGDTSNQKERQNIINQLLLKHYELGQRVVRLKSGDPYVYGRAAEEARFLRHHKLPFQVVPGISAALAAANNCNIPITERGKSNAVLICTAHTADYSLEQLKGIAELLKEGNTLALYMGYKSLDKIIPKLMSVCKNPDIPVNAISNVSRVNEVLLTSTLGEIEEDIKNNPLEMPVVFIIGVKAIDNSKLNKKKPVLASAL